MTPKTPATGKAAPMTTDQTREQKLINMAALTLCGPANVEVAEADFLVVDLGEAAVAVVGTERKRS